MSFNWEPRNLTETRDYAVVTSAKHEVAEITECFDADWTRKAFTPGDHSHLIWCVGNGRQRIGQFIDEAKHTLFLQNERYQDQVIIERLVRAAERGVKVHVMARPAHKLKKEKLEEGVGGLRILDDVGVKVHKLKGLKLHAKLLWQTMSAESSAQSILLQAASTAGGSALSRCETKMWWTACTR